MKITNANLTGSGTKLTLDVTAIAPTLGYTNVSLTRVEYTIAPKDGFQDIILLATPPNGPAVVP